jgi:hypothetical protein
MSMMCVTNMCLWCLLLPTACRDKTDGELPALRSDKAVEPDALASSVGMVCTEHGLQFAGGNAPREDAAVLAVEWPYGLAASGADFI